MRRLLAAIGMTAALCVVTGAHAQQIDQRKFNVVGTWNFLTNWKMLEVPFWNEELTAASGGKLTANLKSVTELSLKGTEVLRLLKTGVFDFAAALPIYVEDGAAIVEAVDIAGVARTFKMSRDIINDWMPEMQAVMRERHGALVLGTFTWPEQNFYCRGDIKSVADLKGKKVRVQGTSQADLVKALGGSAVTLPFGEVVPALEKGVVDCGITGTMPAYKAKWHEVTDTLFRLPVGFTASVWAVNLRTWNSLSPATQALLKKEIDRLSDKSWALVEAETNEGVACTTGNGKCTVGAPGKLKLVVPSADDLAARDKALLDVVLPAWAGRCGKECAAKWNDMVGKKYGLTAKAN
ncbi:MAG: TRAP transporter substrate-binding protein [Alphaproteobacteria bacterium]|nr:TRAP transporter substrate-binding protein [Alphaproteobacteria bacterium]MCW5739994.1 TRAP transporter substrate-binding protein [Alphaproteobacteria bacterium]